MAIAIGVARQVRYKKETTWATAPGTGSAQILRRVESNIALTKNTYESAEIRSDYQVADFRHGTRKVDGAIRGELSLLTWKDFLAAGLRKDFVAGATTTLSTVTATATAPHFVRSAGSWITDGFKVGDLVRMTGWTTTGVPNNDVNYVITALTATDMTVSGTVAAKASGDSVTVTVPGRKTWVPSTGHTDDSFYIEHWHSDIAQSERFAGCKVSKIDVSLPSTGMATIDVTFMGKDMTRDTAAYYVSPTAETTSRILAAVNGSLLVNGVASAVVTGLNFTIDGGHTTGEVIGSNTTPDIFEGRVRVSGQFTCYFENATFLDAFLNETEVTLIATLNATSDADTEAMVFTFPRIKLGSATKDDGEKGIIQTVAFTALLDVDGAVSTAAPTTILIQDTLIP